MFVLPNAAFFKLFSSRPILHSQIFSRPLKKGLHLKSISDSAIFPPISRCSQKKKKRSSPRIDLSFRYFCQKIKVFSKPLVLKVLRERNLGAPRAIRLLIKILTWLILQLSKEAITTYK